MIPIEIHLLLRYCIHDDGLVYGICPLVQSLQQSQEIPKKCPIMGKSLRKLSRLDIEMREIPMYMTTTLLPKLIGPIDPRNGCYLNLLPLKVILLQVEPKLLIE